MDSLFKIYKVDKNEALRIEKSVNDPHQHDFEELTIGLKGQLTHFIDYQVQTVQAPFISFVTKGKIHRVEPKLLDGDCELWVLRFKSEFVPETTFQLYNYYHDQANISMEYGRCFDRIDIICSLIYDEMQHQDSDIGVVRELLSALFTMVETERRKNAPESANLLSNQSTTFRNFIAILEDNFRRSEGVAFYAEKLFMSSRNLNIITQNILHQSVSEIIETRKLIEAKHLLFSTDKSVAEIGFELGYSDKAYFSSVFKKKSGMTPTEFREEMKGLIS
jgi:AraC-like DNA-binding protein